MGIGSTNRLYWCSHVEGSLRSNNVVRHVIRECVCVQYEEIDTCLNALKDTEVVQLLMVRSPRLEQTTCNQGAPSSKLKGSNTHNFVHQ